MKGIATEVTAEVFRLQQQDDRHHSDLSRSLDSKLANQDEQLVSLLHHSDAMKVLPQDLTRLRRKVNEDTRVVLSEITRLQKAMQVDYLPPSKPRRKVSDPSRSPLQSPLPRETRAVWLEAPKKTRSKRPGTMPPVLLTEDVEAELDEPVSPRPSEQEKRFRDWGVQVEVHFKEVWVQTEGSWNELSMERLRQEKRKKKKVITKEETARQQQIRAANFTPIDKLREKATEAAMKRQYSVFDYYKDREMCEDVSSNWVSLAAS